MSFIPIPNVRSGNQSGTRAPHSEIVDTESSYVICFYLFCSTITVILAYIFAEWFEI